MWWNILTSIPSINEPITGVDRGASVYTVIKGHARLWHFYHDEIKGTGKVGMKFNDNSVSPWTQRTHSTSKPHTSSTTPRSAS